MFLFRSAPRLREAPPKNPKIKIFFLETSMSNRSKDRSSLCSFMFVDGRHCRIPRRVDHPYLCVFHKAVVAGLHRLRKKSLSSLKSAVMLSLWALSQGDF